LDLLLSSSDVLQIWSILIFILVIVFFKVVIPRLEEFQHQRQRCPHGVRNGRVNCSECQRIHEEEMVEFNRIEEENRLKKQEAEKFNKSAKFNERQVKQIQYLDVVNLRKITPSTFESLVAKLYLKLGYEYQKTPATNDHGRDGIAMKNAQKYVIEVKRYKEGNKIGRPDLQKFSAVMRDDEADHGHFICLGGFSGPGIVYAKEHNIELIGPNEFVALMKDAYGDGLEFEIKCPICNDVVKTKIQRDITDISCGKGHSLQDVLVKMYQEVFVGYQTSFLLLARIGQVGQAGFLVQSFQELAR